MKIVCRQNSEKSCQKTTFIEFFEKTVVGLIRSLIEELLSKEIAEHQKIIAPKEKKYLNGSYFRSLITRFGLIEQIRVPRLRAIKFRSKIFSPWQRRMEGIDEIITKVFIQGESYRDIKRFFRMMFSDSISLSTITRITNKFLRDVNEFHNRKIEKYYQMLWIDGIYFKVKQQTQSVIILLMGMDLEGKKEIIDFMISKSEDYWTYRRFLKSIKQRAIRIDEMTMIIHDGHAGIQRAVEDVFGQKTNQQNCIFHKLQNIQFALKDKSRKKEVLSAAKHVYSADHYAEYELRKHEFIKTYRYKEPDVVRVVKRDMLIKTKFLLPVYLHKLVNTTNPLERQVKEIRRRTKVIGVFENNKSLEKIVYLTINFINQTLGNLSFSSNLAFTQF